LSLLVAATWIAIGFFVLRYAGQRFVFHEPRRADIAAAAVVLAFVIGAYWPLSDRLGAGPDALPAAGPGSSSVAAPALAPAALHDVSSECTNKKLARTSEYGVFDSLSGSEKWPKDIPRRADVRGTAFYVARGWAAVLEGRVTPAKAVCLVVDGNIESRATTFYGAARPDVAAAFSVPALNPTGFTIFVPPALLSGHHHVQAAVEKPDGTFSVLNHAWDVAPSGAVTALR
jgi:hypothetical protein